MIVTLKTMIHHSHNVDGTPRAEHCCGCFNVSLDEDAPDRPYAQCNECGEIHVFSAPSVNVKD